MVSTYNETTSSVAASTANNTLTAFFDSRSDAKSAVERLKGAGIPERAIRFMPDYESDSDLATTASDDRSGFWASLSDWFFPEEDRATYAEGLRRGGFLVCVQVDDASYETAHDILDDQGSIDIDERADTWRKEGWDAQRSNEAFASYERNAGVSSIERTQQAAASREDAFATDRDETIPVVEEKLRVGKRDVNNGSVRVRAYTIETPVHEDVKLRDENAETERRTLDRPLTDADRSFQDRTILAEEHHEEAVVPKDASVIEEMAPRKTASDRTETVNDTVRKTEVEGDDKPTGGQSQSQNRFGQSQDQGFRRD
ncbi:stress response protein YsnF [Rhizobium sp. BK313]|uniref:YsnF/AvaK domain-containing protein n=1 Tax=Rhizobium sp. BK313 TaxID=2587081 RepID=UPI00105B900F|nr:YsnF/AvaK domain-containing protein [Rhizobium sp. BK313]MBB3452634.1 stress response protein YsnF [Rhizobium sp. BK313]